MQYGLLVLLLVSTTLTREVARADTPYQIDKYDSQKVLGVEKCRKCHTQQVLVLQKHAHFASFQSLHRNPRAKEFAKALGERSVKRSKSCIRCHYTTQQTNTGTKAISGISCESCHGPSKDWVLLHNDYGGPDAKPETESALHKQWRITTSMEKGLRHPSHLYTLARSCFRCHVVNDEELVNKTAHPIRSLEFNMASWTQGAMRHNYHRTNGERNALSDLPRLQIMYVVSVLTEFEFSLRATGGATNKSDYVIRHAQHCDALRRKLEAIQAKVNHPQLEKIMTIVRNVRLSFADRGQLIVSADQLSKLTWEFAQTVDGKELDAIASEVPPPRTR